MDKLWLQLRHYCAMFSGAMTGALQLHRNEVERLCNWTFTEFIVSLVVY
jgi:hypothetical protein